MLLCSSAPHGALCRMRYVDMGLDRNLLQDLSKLDVAKLNPLSPEVISRQATINIGAHALALVRTTRVTVRM